MSDQDPAVQTTPWRVLAAFATPSLPLSALSLPIVVYLPTFYANVVGVPLAIVGAAFMMVRIGDILLDPLIGSVMDGTRSRFGRYRLWMLLGGPVTILGSMFLFFPPSGAGAPYLVLSLIGAYVGYSICVLAHTAWGATLSQSYHERARIYGVWQSANIIGILIVLSMPVIAAASGFHRPGDGVRAMGLFVILAMPVALLIMSTLVPDRSPTQKAAHRSLTKTIAVVGGMFRHANVLRVLGGDFFLSLAPGITGALFLFYFGLCKGDTGPQSSGLLICYFLGGIVGAPIWMRLSRRLGKHRALLLASAYYCASQLSIVFMPHLAYVQAALILFVAGLAYAASAFLLRALMADVVDEVALKTGRSENSVLFALVGSTNKLAYSVAVGITFVLLDLAGFHAAAGAKNSPEALQALSAVFGFVPPALATIGALIFWGYPLTEARHADIREELDRLHIKVEHVS